MPGLSYDNNMKGWGPELCARRPDITMAMVDKFLTNMYRARADFVYTATRDFVRSCQTPILVLPDDVPAHPYAVAMETVHLAPNAQVSLYPWKDTPDKIPLAVRHIRTFLRANRPVAASAIDGSRRPVALTICNSYWIGCHPDPVRHAGSGGFQDTKLCERSDPVVEFDLLRDLAVLDPQYGGAREVHLPAGRR